MPKYTIKTKPTDNSVIDYIASYPNPKIIQDCLDLIDFFANITNEEAVLWGKMIGFGNYHYKYSSGHEGDIFPVGFAPSKVGITIYLSSCFEGEADNLAKLGKYKISKSCLYIKKLSDIDLNILAKIITSGNNYIKEKYQI